MPQENYFTVKNSKLEISTLLGFSLVGVLVKLIFNTKTDETGENGSATSTMWGYGISAISLFCVLFIQIGLNARKTMLAKADPYKLFEFIGSNIEIILVIILLALVSTVYYLYYKKINIGIIPPEFNSYALLSSIIFIVQIMMLFQTYTLIFDQNKSMITFLSEKTLSLIGYLLSTINFILLIMMFITIKYYTTDG